jgi:predicted transcriptional regulator
MKQILISRNVRLVSDEWDKLNILADKNNMRISELIRLAIKQYLKYH